MASTAASGRGRRKQAKPQRKQVELDSTAGTEDTVLTAVSASVGSPMSPDTNHNNHQHPDNNPKESSHHHNNNNNNSGGGGGGGKHLLNGHHKEAAIPEQVVANGAANGLSLQGLLTMQVVKSSGGVASDVPKDLVSAKAAVGEQQEEEQKIQEYLQRSDTAVIFPEPVDHSVHVPALTNGVTKEDEDAAGTEHFIKCPQCQKGCSSFQSLKEHIECCHPHAIPEEGSTASLPPASAVASPPPAAVGTGGPYGCSQCTTSFSTKDQLEKHELLHSPNAQVSCKVCHKTFANVYRLQRHMISHDESAILRKFKCTECEKAFKFKHHLKEHIRIHSGEKPFECANCGKRFSHSGSYSSHMTSKKCLVMNLKMGRNRASSASNSLLDKNHQSPSSRLQKRSSTTSLNNNITTSPNHNSYLPILPKYSEAAAAAFLSVMAPRDPSYPPPTSTPAMHPFYMTPPALHLGPTGHPMSPYTMPASLGQLLEQLQTGSPHRTSQSVEHLTNQDNQSSSTAPADDDNKAPSTCSELVMDTDDDDHKRPPSPESNSGDLEAVKRILETVNATVTKQFLQANMQKLSTTDSVHSDCRSETSHVSIDEKSSATVNCESCKKQFSSRMEMDMHECDSGSNSSVEMRSEGLAAKLEEAVHVKSEEPATMNGGGSVSGAEEDHDTDSKHNDKSHDDYEIDNESVTTTDHVSEDGRKVRVRSLIADEQLTILKDHYALNPRPKREELARIAERIGFPVRVVQVWFQNTRARDRREGRLVQIPYSPIPATSLATCFAQSLVPSTTPHLALRTLPYGQTSPHYLPPHQQHQQQGNSAEQPLDLSTKKEPASVSSSPSSSPYRPASAIAHSDSGEEAVNLSHKSSRSPTPFHQLPYQSTTHYQSSNCSSDYRRSPSPVSSGVMQQQQHATSATDAFTNGSRLARILAQPAHPAHRLAMAAGSAMGLMPMERLLHYNPELKSPLLNTASSSPNSERRSWKMEDNEDSVVSQEMYAPDDDLSCPTKRSKVSHMALKSLNNTLLPTGGSAEPEIEGQFICGQCDKAFSKQSSLARHKYEHSGQRPHKCDECPKAFKHKHHLTEHKRLHSGEKPFQCSKCLKRFSHSGSYSQHMNHRYSYCKPYRE